MNNNIIQQNENQAIKVKIRILNKLIKKNQIYQLALNQLILNAKSLINENKAKLKQIEKTYQSIKSKRKKNNKSKYRLVNLIPFYQNQQTSIIPNALINQKYIRQDSKKSFMNCLLRNQNFVEIQSLKSKYMYQLGNLKFTDKWTFIVEFIKQLKVKNIVFHEVALLANYYRLQFQIYQIISSTQIHQAWIMLFKNDIRSHFIQQRYLETKTAKKFKVIKTNKFIPWTQQQKKKIILFVQTFGQNWNQLAVQLQPRKSQQLSQLWHSQLNPKTKKGKWTLVQDVKLLILYQYFGNKWSQISEIMQTRNDIQIRERFCNILDPGLTKLIWTNEEDNRLINYAPMFNFQWSKLNRFFENKTDNSLWRRYRKLMSHKDKHKQKQLVGNLTMIEKINRYKIKKSIK